MKLPVGAFDFNLGARRLFGRVHPNKGHPALQEGQPSGCRRGRTQGRRGVPDRPGDAASWCASTPRGSVPRVTPPSRRIGLPRGRCMLSSSRRFLFPSHDGRKIFRLHSIGRPVSLKDSCGGLEGLLKPLLTAPRGAAANQAGRTATPTVSRSGPSLIRKAKAILQSIDRLPCRLVDQLRRWLCLSRMVHPEGSNPAAKPASQNFGGLANEGARIAGFRKRLRCRRRACVLRTSRPRDSPDA
jgi:hypothetical protein